MSERLRALISFHEVVIGARLLWRLPASLRHPISPAEARVTLCRRLERREADFLALVSCTIYQHAASPYRHLLDLAGCTYGALERLVQQEGVEGALSHLFRRGVYLTIDEFKGHRPMVRGSATFTVDPVRRRNAHFSACIVMSSLRVNRSSSLISSRVVSLGRRFIMGLCLMLFRGGRWRGHGRETWRLGW